MDVYKYQIFADIDESTMAGFSSFIDLVPKDSRVLIEITSHGGLVFYGNAVYQKIQEAQRQGIEFTAKVYGIAASSAADIVLSCNRIEMASTAAIMIHSAWNDAGKEDQGISIANDAQLAVIRKRIPGYTADDLKADRWFTADEALKIGLIDSIFDVESDSIQARLCAKYLSTHTKGESTMDEEKKKDEQIDESKAEIVEEEVKEEEIKEEKEPSIDDVLERIAERFDLIEERLRKIEEMSAECGGDRRDSARMKAVYEKIAAITKPCVSCDSVIHIDTQEDPKASLDKCNEKYPNLDKLVGVD